MRSYIYIILILAAALVAVSIRLAQMSNDGETPTKPDSETEAAENPAYKNIMTRASVREFKNQPVPDSIVEKIMRAAMAAPTARNKQPWEYVVVDRKEIIDTIATSLDKPPLKTAPLAIVVCGVPKIAGEGNAAYNWILDTSASTENILLAAHSLGLGAVWLSVYPDYGRIATLSKLLGIPASSIPLCVVAVGYPTATPQPKEKWLPSKLHYNTY